MGAREGIVVGGLLLALCWLIAGAAAFETGGSGSPPGAAPAAALPAFLDRARMPDVEAAFRAQARAAMKRAKQDGPAAAAVRRRAEALSRRFDAGTGAANKPAETAKASEMADESPPPPPYAIGADPSADRSGQTAGMVPERGPKPQLKPNNARAAAQGFSADTPTAALPDAAPTVSAAATPSKPPAALSHLSTKIPPVPLQARRHEASKPVVRHARAASAPRRSPPAARRDLRGEAFPSYMRAFGWNSQPR